MPIAETETRSSQNQPKGGCGCWMCFGSHALQPVWMQSTVPISLPASRAPLCVSTAIPVPELLGWGGGLGWESGSSTIPQAHEVPALPDCVKRRVSHEAEIHNSGKI